MKNKTEVQRAAPAGVVLGFFVAFDIIVIPPLRDDGCAHLVVAIAVVVVVGRNATKILQRTEVGGKRREAQLMMAGMFFERHSLAARSLPPGASHCQARKARTHDE